MDWSYGLAVTGFIFVAIGTLIIVVSHMTKGREPNHGWAFILLGIILVVVFGIGIQDLAAALGFPPLSSGAK
jgi:hypothetical protein